MSRLSPDCAGAAPPPLGGVASAALHASFRRAHHGARPGDYAGVRHLRRGADDAISSGMADVGEIAAFLDERRKACSGMLNREQADARLASDIARVRIEYGDAIVAKVMALAATPASRPMPMASGINGRKFARG
jgi:hypothetical protein